MTNAEIKQFDNARITFHTGNGFSPEGIEKKPFATFTINTLITSDALDAIIKIVREHVNTAHRDCCNVKMSTQDWDY